jgi:protein-S-isoprenylcysteine O-methyltransferase Ste14
LANGICKPQHLQYLIGFLEIITILASTYPSSPLSRWVLTLTTTNSAPGAPNLHLSPANILGAALILAGARLRLSTFRHMGALFTFGASIHPAHRLVTAGPYAAVWHPSYTGMLLSHPGWFLWQFARGSWVRESGVLGTAVGKIAVGAYAVFIVVFPLYLVLSRMEVEDRALRERFGREWDEWAGRVRYRVIPGVY